MASINISLAQERYPGKTEKEVAEIIAEEGDYVIVVKYKLQPDGPYTNYGLCRTYDETDNYLFNENLYDVDVIYDRRNTTKPIPEILHNAQAITRNITFEEGGYAPEPCCWNCRHFTIPTSGEYLCCRDQSGRGVVKIQRGDLCNYWHARHPSTLIDSNPSIQNDELPIEDNSSNILSGFLSFVIPLGLNIFIMFRYGTIWAKSLESMLGVPYDIWMMLFVFIAIGLFYIEVFLLLKLFMIIESRNQKDILHPDHNDNIAAEDQSVTKKDKLDLKLVDAALDDNLPEMKRLIQAGADVNAKNDIGKAALHYACASNHLDIVKFLLNNGAEVDIRDQTGITPLISASQDGFKDIVHELLVAGANPDAASYVSGGFSIYIASARGHSEVVKDLIKYGANVDAPYKGFTPLMWACYEGHKPVVQALIEGRADINIVGAHDFTALYIAEEQNHKEIVEYLRSAGARDDGYEKHKTGNNEKKDFDGKAKKCLNCDEPIPQDQLECPSCGSSYFIWE